MTALLTAAQMRAIENRAISTGRASGLQLMERAGQAVADVILAEWPPHPPQADAPDRARRALVLCGPGNNGGDGFVVARLLAGAGWAVDCWRYGAADRLPPDAAANHRRYAALHPVRPWDDQALADGLRAGADGLDLVVDALFGIGLSRPLPQDMAQTIAALQQVAAGPGSGPGPGLGPRILALDLPSGLCADSGKPIGGPLAAVVPADLTVTFHRPKIGHLMVEHCGPNGGASGCKRLVVMDIGLGADQDDARADWLGAADPRIWKRPQQHKYDHGHALVLAGGMARGGAARMAARAALRVGAGLVTLAPPPAALAENAARLDAVMLRGLEDAAALDALLQDRRINALCLGPGLGLGPREAGLLECALRAGRSMVLDADALTLLARAPALFARLHPGCVLTPHGGEFARLFPDLAAAFATAPERAPGYSKLDACRAAAARAGAVVLYKGADTVIAAPDGQVIVQAALYGREVPWLATAGAGDVLAGLIAGLLARGLEPLAAAGTAAWLHVECARAFGPGLIAEDLPEALPGLLRRLLG